VESTATVYTFFNFLHRAACSRHYILLDLMILTVTGEVY